MKNGPDFEVTNKIIAIRNKINNYLVPELESDKKRLDSTIEKINKNKLRITQLEIELNDLHCYNDNLQRDCERYGKSIKNKEKKLEELRSSLVDAILQE